MEEYKKKYDKGIEYFYNAINFSKSNKFGKAITLNVISLSAANLLSSILVKNEIYHCKTEIQNILSSLEKNNLVPIEIITLAHTLNKQCSSIITTEINTTELTNTLRFIKQWVESEVNHLRASPEASFT